MRNWLYSTTFFFMALRFLVGLSPYSAYSAVFTVSNTADIGSGSLRRAINSANSTAGIDTVEFNIPGAGPYTIQLSSALSNITETIFIDGTTQPGFSGTPLIEISGNNSVAVGLVVAAGGSTVRSLVINRFTDKGIEIRSQNNLIVGNFVGTDATGMLKRGNGGDGIAVFSSNNTIGGTSLEDRNVISGNGGRGVSLVPNAVVPLPVRDNIIMGNYIGVNANGTAPLGNSSFGVAIINASENIVGGEETGAGNVISASLQFDGIAIAANSNGAADNNTVAGNFIGTDATGTVALGNARDGILIQDSNDNTIGGTTASARNVISGNKRFGVHIIGEGSTGNEIQGNYIGVNKSGSLALGNIATGVAINDASGNIVGGDDDARNVISGNGFHGVRLGLAVPGTNEDNVIQGNNIGIDFTGTEDLGNGQSGVFIEGCSNITVSDNVISGNVNGVFIDGTIHPQISTEDISIQGNFIGTDDSGLIAIGNQLNGITISRSFNNTIGGAFTSDRNVISGNGQHGIQIAGDGGDASGTIIQGNFIGLNAAGTELIPNMSPNAIGIFIVNSDASNLTIGGSDSTEKNIIAGHDINILASSNNNSIKGNHIGVDLNGAILNGNDRIGISLSRGSNNQIGGTEQGGGNLIRGHSDTGILLVSASNDNHITGNIISSNSVNGIGISDDGVNNAISANSIYDNGSLGIDLNKDGVTLNDLGDLDVGPNNLQNFPFLTFVGFGDILEVKGTISAIPETEYRIEIFANTSCDPTGFGEGEIFIGADSVITSASGDGGFTFNFPDPAFTQTFFSATATDPSGNTSEIGLCFEPVAIPNAPVLLLPQNGAAGLDAVVTFSWSPVESADRYRLQVSTVTDFSSTVFDDENLMTTMTDVSQLQDTTLFYWRVQAGNTVGFGPFSAVQIFSTGLATHIPGNTDLVPGDFVLQQNYPNPFNPQTQITFGLPAQSQVSLAVYDIKGRLIETLVDEALHAGWHEVAFFTGKLATGTYIYRLQTPSGVLHRKMILIK